MGWLLSWNVPLTAKNHPPTAACYRQVHGGGEAGGGCLGDWEAGWLRWLGGKLDGSPTLSGTSVNNLAPDPLRSISKQADPLKSDMVWRDYSIWKQDPVEKINWKQANFFFFSSNGTWVSENVYKHLMIRRVKCQHLSCHNLHLGMYRSLSMLASHSWALCTKNNGFLFLRYSLSLIKYQQTQWSCSHPWVLSSSSWAQCCYWSATIPCLKVMKTPWNISFEATGIPVSIVSVIVLLRCLIDRGSVKSDSLFCPFMGDLPCHVSTVVRSR